MIKSIKTRKTIEPTKTEKGSSVDEVKHNMEKAALAQTYLLSPRKILYKTSK